MIDVAENRAPLASLSLWVGVFVLDSLLSPRLGSAVANLVFYLPLLVACLVLVPLYLSAKWNVGDAGIFLGFSLIFWAAGDFACGYFSLGSGGICYLLRQWYPSPFLVIMRVFGGSILVMYLVLNPDVGTEKAALPGLGMDEGRWLVKVGLVLFLVLLGGYFLFQSLSKSSFGGDVLYVLTADYGGLRQPELIYNGILGQLSGDEGGYVLVREHLNLTNLAIGRIEGVPWDSTILEGYLGSDVEILGKLSEFSPGEIRFLFPGRVRLSVARS